MKPLLLFILLTFVPSTLHKQSNLDGYFEDDKFVVVKFDPDQSDIRMFYKNEDGEVIGDFGRLKDYVQSFGSELIFATNGGMFMHDLRPLGLYMEDGKEITPLNTRSASTNFYIKPNGVFYILYNGTVGICKTGDFNSQGVKYATQSGGMLTIDGEINPKYNENSTSYYTRNGVGVDGQGCVIFVLSKIEVNLYDLAQVFWIIGCDNSLYLDGGLSDMYCPEIGLTYPHQYMSVMIAVVK